MKHTPSNREQTTFCGAIQQCLHNVERDVEPEELDEESLDFRCGGNVACDMRQALRCETIEVINVPCAMKIKVELQQRHRNNRIS